jgi:ABC-type transporter Mla subunit MlaD
MANYQRNEIVPGLFVLAAAAVFVLFAFRVGRWEVLNALKGERLVCRAVFDEVKTLSVGAKVSVAGRRVGEVSRLRWTELAYDAADIDVLRRQLGTLPAGVREGLRRLVVEVEFELADAGLRLDPGSAQVALMQEGLLGQYFLDLYPGYWEEAAQPETVFAAGFTPPVSIRARRAGGFEAIAGTLGGAIESIEALTRTLRDGVLSEQNRAAFTGLLQSLGGAARDIGELLRADNADGLQQAAIQPLRRALDTAASSVDDVRRRLLESSMPKAEQALDEAKAGAAEFRTALAAARADLARVLDQLEGAVLDLRPEVAESARRLRSSLWQAELALRKIRLDPSVLLFGSDEQDLEARDPGAAGLGPTGRARPYRQRDEGADGR